MKITMSLNEFDTLVNFIDMVEGEFPDINKITLEVTETGIGPHIMAFVETEEGKNQGVYKDITDYENW